MRGFVVGLAVLAIGPAALANDLMYKHDKAKPAVLAPFDGFAHWQLAARCSGLMQARLDYDAASRRKSPEAEAGIPYFRAEAVKRYMADRSVDQSKAQAVVTYYENAAMTEFKADVEKHPGVGGRTPANARLNECLAIATALSPPAAPPPRLLAKGAGQERMICETSGPTGSRLGKRVCRTAEQAAADRREGREQTERLQELGGCRLANGC